MSPELIAAIDPEAPGRVSAVTPDEAQLIDKLITAKDGAERFYGVLLDDAQLEALSAYVEAVHKRSLDLEDSKNALAQVTKDGEVALKADPQVSAANAALQAAVQEAVERLGLNAPVEAARARVQAVLDDHKAALASAYAHWMSVAPASPLAAASNPIPKE